MHAYIKSGYDSGYDVNMTGILFAFLELFCISLHFHYCAFSFCLIDPMSNHRTVTTGYKINQTIQTTKSTYTFPSFL